MASLTVRNIPESVLKRLRQAARESRRSVNAQAITWLEEAAQRWNSPRDWDQLLKRIRSRREAIYRRHGMGSDSAAIIREMRNGRGKAAR